ncbi:MAG: glycosyltransferase family 4 protein [Dysgonamonadaceae bacterium]|jgi:glycosyltransferase involved in cell wall biosynthesis|nr:glycosyltransferase family 4 protein [Dysgonamonadaceae bacterium]
MKILLLSTSERTGGAAIATNRLMHALNKSGQEAKMLVRDKQTDDPQVAPINTDRRKKKINFIRFAYERWVIFLNSRFGRKNLFAVSIANTGTDISKHPLVKEADIIHLHWINQGFLSLTDIRKLIESGKPVVWTMHDMWVFTGICHHAWGCEAFTKACGNCSFLASKKKNDLSARVLKGKRFLAQSNIRLVAVSSWLKNLAEKSVTTGKLNISVIPNVIDTSVFSPSDKQAMRNKYSFPPEKKIIIMGAAKINDTIKGFDILRQALPLIEDKENLLLLLFGEIKKNGSFLSDMPVEYVYMGLLSDTSVIAELYAAADVTVVPSHYETFGQTLIESMACGCPVVSFNNSGQADIVNHQTNGYLAEYKNVEDLAAGITWVLENTEKLRLSDACVKKAKENYSETVVAGKYIALYTDLLTGNGSL